LNQILHEAIELIVKRCGGGHPCSHISEFACLAFNTSIVRLTKLRMLFPAFLLLSKITSQILQHTKFEKLANDLQIVNN
jgi:hypothetical protein